MFSCLYNLWDWLDPSMEKKASLHNTTVVTTTATSGGVHIDTDAIPKHQHNTPPQYIRYMQQGLKIPNNQQHQRQSPMIHPHMHQSYQNALQSMQKHSYNASPTIHTNPLHMHYNNQYIYQQSKLKQQQQHQQMSPISPIYQTHQQAATYQHNPNLTPQPWVPPHSSISNAVYQSQNQIKSEPGTPTTTTSSTNTMNTMNMNLNLTTTTSTPVHNKRELERKKSGGHQQLRSPSAKRPSDAPVTLQGWLHKQGSDGLMLWKKRWFVLSEYVLFYYKGPEEEKLLGSLLLPSYRVSICGPEDKANKKFAFKCEHTNMRTYVLAADTQDLMMQWARALNLASLLQSNAESDSSLNTPSSYNPPMEHNTTIESNYNNSVSSNTNPNPILQQPQPTQTHPAHNLRLPLHAHSSSNATDFSNPSQELNHVNMSMSQYNQPLYANAPPKPRRLNDTGYSSPSPETLDRYNEPKYVTLQPPPYMRQMSKSNSVYSQDSVYSQNYQAQHQQYIVQNSERRTPDTYGRSKSHLMNGSHVSQNGRHHSDYEDIYAEQYMYKRPLSPIAYNKSISITTPMTPIQRSYTPMSITRSGDGRDPRDSRDVQQRKISQSVPRPHSADFLEYEATHRLNQSLNINQQPARPKSSLDINRNGDNYFYSEERYAEKMRKSAQYLSKGQGKHSASPRRSQEVQQDNTFPLMRSSTQPLNYATTPIEYGSVRREVAQPTRCRSVLSEGSISKELDGDIYGSQYKDMSNAQPDHLYGYGDPLREYDPFTRSASARLANIEQRLQGDGRASMNKEGERKREESMKRLLEWKQRMLQSPLNRKMNQNVNKAYSKPEYYKRNGSYTRHTDGRSGIGQYNSYSSDDEENADTARLTQAGRTSAILSPDTCAPYTPLSLLDSSPPQTDTLSTITTTAPPLSPDPDRVRSPLVDELEATRCTTPANPILIQPKPAGALVKSILAEFNKLSAKSPVPPAIDSPRTPTQSKDIDAIIEENYMIMTPKKNTFDFGNPERESTTDVEENPYVEMSQGLTPSVLDPGYQSYEIVTFGDTMPPKMEPLYMELRPKMLNTLEKSSEVKKNELPDILLPSSIQDSKSDSSDADDEASKDLESLYSTNPRFSLSDVFRPASYYLGASQTTLPEQDSSDSELVSPPPIPRSPPPMEDFNQSKCEDNKGSSNTNNKDNLSICSIQTDEARRFSHSQNSDSDVEYVRKDIQRLLKRRPVSEEFRDEVESLDSEFNSTDIKKYLAKIDDDLAYSNRYHDYENMIVRKLSSPKILHTRELSKDSQGTTYLSETSERSIDDGNIINECAFLDVDVHRLEDSAQSGFDFSLGDKEQYEYGLTSAPYYYSDLGLNTNALYGGGILKLNNQRGTNNGGKRDITHIVNPIRASTGNNRPTSNIVELTLGQYKLANELATRSASVDFLNLTDKSGQIDQKNVYESDTLKRLKVVDTREMDFAQNPELRNVYPCKKDDKFVTEDATSRNNESIVRRTHSLEGLLENVLGESNDLQTSTDNTNTEGSYLWEEDSIWRERLRNASQRHTKSLDDLDCVGTTKVASRKSPKVKKPSRAITRDVVYVNDAVYNMPVQEKYAKQDATTCNSKPGKRGSRGTGSFAIDRETLRQWDLMSSAPSDGGRETRNAGRVRGGAEVEFGGGDENRAPQPKVAQEAASGSLSMGMRDTFIHNNMPTQRDYQPINQPHQSRSTTNLHRHLDSEYGWPDYYLSPAPSQQNIDAENRKIPWNAKVKLSAGDLLGRTHEELVLLLIQLRRQSTNLGHAIEAGYAEIDNIQAQLHLMDAAKRMESLQKLEQIKQHLLDLEKQYEKGKPMVNLVDNMVKLGSLYRFPSTDRSSSYSTRDRIEFNQQMQEKKLLDDERRDWNRVNSSHLQLHEKVQQLYELDQLIQEGSGTLQGLQQDKEDIERALGGIRMRLMQGYTDPEIIEKAKKQQSILENELSRVHLMLAQNSKKLEETVAGNARLEQELLVLRQKLQVSKQSHNRSSPQFSNPGDSLTCIGNIGNSNGAMESDLQKVQQKVGDLQKQRQELSMQVRQLTDRSSIPSKTFSPTHQQDGKKKINSGWRETDLDTMYIRDHGEGNHWESTSSIPSSIPSIPSTVPSNYGNMSPLYIKTDLKFQNSTQSNQSHGPPPEDIYGRTLNVETPTEDYSSPQFVMPLPQEKQEIKTVRIVKRESERRHRDRDRDKPTPNKYDALIEDDFYTSSPTRPTTLSVQKTLSATSLTYPEDNLSRTSSTPSMSQFDKDASPVLSPVFKSEAARQIITEMAQETPKNKNRRAVPIEKRRHYTAPHNNLIRKSFNQLPTTDDDTFNKAVLDTRRARDDLDMERALRQRIDAPDVVRSTLSSKELKYNESTIDSLFGTPNKIVIPERYIPEQTPQLSAEEEEHRLRKVESIKKMLSDSTILSTSTANLANEDEAESSTSNATTTKATTKMIEEKKQREHLLQLNQILAKQVMEMSKIVAVKALSKLPTDSQTDGISDDEDSSPMSPLPLYQQRDNFYS